MNVIGNEIFVETLASAHHVLHECVRRAMAIGKDAKLLEQIAPRTNDESGASATEAARRGRGGTCESRGGGGGEGGGCQRWQQEEDENDEARKGEHDRPSSSSGRDLGAELEAESAALSWRVSRRRKLSAPRCLSNRTLEACILKSE